jgi:TolB protein
MVVSPWRVAVGTLVLLAVGASAASASFPGRPGKIAFVSDASGSNDLVVMNADGSGRENLTSGPDDDLYPAWSPDGRVLAFVRGGAVYVIRSDGGGIRRLTTGASPAWSPDGRRLVLSRPIGRTSDLFTVGVDGRGLRRLTRTPASAESDPEWSPDGRLIAYTRAFRRPAGAGANVYVVRPTGGGVRRVTSGGSPTWSPDSLQLALIRTDESLGRSRVFVATADGARVRPLVGELQLDPAATFESDPSWSPDGKRVVFVRGARLYSDLYVASVDGRFLRRMTDNAIDQVTDRQPAWQRLPRKRSLEG